MLKFFLDGNEVTPEVLKSYSLFLEASIGECNDVVVLRETQPGEHA